MSFINHRQKINNEVKARQALIKDLLIEMDIALDLLIFAKEHDEKGIAFYTNELNKVRTKLFDNGFFREGEKK